MSKHAPKKRAGAAAAPKRAVGEPAHANGPAVANDADDLRVPGVVPDFRALLPWIDADDVAPAKKQASAPAPAAEPAKGIPPDFAEKIANMKAAAFAVEIASLEYDKSPNAKYRLHDILERADDSLTRKKLKQQYAQQNNGTTLETYIDTSSNLGESGKKNALDLVSGRRDVATDKLAAMDSEKRAAMEDQAAVWASKVFDVTRSDDRDDSEHADKIASILGPRSPEELELIRARMRTQTSGTKRTTAFEELDRTFTGRDENIALSALSGNHVQVAATQLIDAAAEKDPDRVNRIVEELGPEKLKQLNASHAVFLQQVATSMPSDQRKQVEAALAGREAAADAARFGELLSPVSLSSSEAISDPAKAKRKMMIKEAQSPERLIEELSKKSPAELQAAREEWDKGGHDKTWDQLIADRYKGVDSTLRLRIEAASQGDKIGEKALRLRQGMRTFDQKLIDGALVNPDLKSNDAQKRGVAEIERTQLEMRVRDYDANDKRTSAMLEGKQTGDFAGRSMDEQLAAHYEKAKTQDTKAGSGLFDQASHLVEKEERMKKIADKATADSYAASEMWTEGDARAATKVRRAELAGNSMQKAEILERLDSKSKADSTNTLASTSAEYSSKFGGREMLKAPDLSEAREVAETFARMTGDTRSPEEIAKALARSEMNVGELRTQHVRESGVLADRSRTQRVAQQTELRDLSHSSWLEGSEEWRYMMGGNRGSEDLLTSSINMMKRGNAEGVDDREAARRDRATTGALMLQREEKQREAAKIAQVLSIASKIAAVLTMNPALFVAVDAGFSALRIAAQEMIANEAYEMTADLKHMCVDMIINIATAKLGGLGKGLEVGSQAAKTAATMQRVGNVGVAVGGAMAHSAIDGQELGGGGIVRAGLGAVLPGYVRGKTEGVIKGTGKVATATRAIVGTASDAVTSAGVGGGNIDAANLISSVGNTYQNHAQTKKAPGHVDSHASAPRMPDVDVDVPATPRAKRTTIPMPTVAEPAHARTTREMTAVVPPSERVTQREMPAVQAPVDGPDAAAVARSWEKSKEHLPPPTTYTEAIERSSGVDKGAEYAQFGRDMASMYAQQEIDAQNVTRVQGSPIEQKKDGSYYQGKQDYDVRRFGYDNGTLTSVTIDAHVRAGAGTTPEQVEAVKRSAYQGTDQIMNRNAEGKRHELPDGSKLQVEPIFHDDAAKARHVVDVIQPGFKPDGTPLHSNQAEWVLPQVLNPTGAAHELVGHGLGFPDTYVDPMTWFRDTPNAPGVTRDGNFMETVAPGAGLQQHQLDQLGRDIGAGGAVATAPQGAATTAPEMPKQRPDEASLARSIAEIPVHRLPTPKDGESAMSGHPDTYYLSREDAGRMQQMLELQEGTKVRAYEKGFIARRGGEEWYFEVRDTKGLDPVQRAQEADPNGPAPDMAMENAMPMREDGMPTPNAATVEVWGFRGARSIGGRDRREWTADERAHAEAMKQIQPLLYAGHIGVSTDGGDSIQGYTPQVPEGMSVDDAIKALFRYEAFPGNVLDDTHVFELATQMAAQHDWNTRPVSAVQLVDPAAKQEIMRAVARLKGESPDEHGLAYSFPTGRQGDDGHYFKETERYAAECVANCATFPTRVGVQTPEPTGNLNVYMPELLKWAEADGPIDLRTQPGAKKKKDEDK